MNQLEAHTDGLYRHVKGSSEHIVDHNEITYAFDHEGQWLHS
jgi:hypothetical protein